MRPEEIEALHMTANEAAEYLEVGERRIFALVAQGLLTKMKGGIYSREEVESYKVKRGDKKGGRYPALATVPKATH